MSKANDNKIIGWSLGKDGVFRERIYKARNWKLSKDTTKNQKDKEARK